MDPNNKNYLDTYGWILFQRKKYAEAVKFLEAAAKGNSKNANILEHFGDALYRTNKTEEAFAQWNLAKQAGGNSESLINKIKNKKIND